MLVAWSFCGSVSVLLFFHSWHHVSLWNLSPPCRWEPSCQQQPAASGSWGRVAARECLKSFSLRLLRFPVQLPWPVTSPLLSRASSRARTPPAPAPWTLSPMLTTGLWKAWRSGTSAPTATWSCATPTRRDAGTASASSAFLLWGESRLRKLPSFPCLKKAAHVFCKSAVSAMRMLPARWEAEGVNGRALLNPVTACSVF